MGNVERNGRSEYGCVGEGAVRPTDRDVLWAAYAHFNARAIDSALALMHSDVEWPDGIEGGFVHGHEGVREYWARQWSVIDPHAEPIDFLLNENGTTVVTVHLIIRRPDGSVAVDENVNHSYRFEDGLIRKMDFGGE